VFPQHPLNLGEFILRRLGRRTGLLLLLLLLLLASDVGRVVVVLGDVDNGTTLLGLRLRIGLNGLRSKRLLDWIRDHDWVGHDPGLRHGIEGHVTGEEGSQLFRGVHCCVDGGHCEYYWGILKNTRFVIGMWYINAQVLAVSLCQMHAGQGTDSSDKVSKQCLFSGRA